VGGSEGSRVFETLAFLNLTRGLFRCVLTAVTSPRGASEHGFASDSESDDEVFTSVPLKRSSMLSDLADLVDLLDPNLDHLTSMTFSKARR
jgi:hypothetical protein